jgi:MOSC domain-containing protein YiiM
MSRAQVTSVNLSSAHSFSKVPSSYITLIAGYGVQSDAHCGVTVQQSAKVATNPNQPNLRQVHLMHEELFDELARDGYQIGSGNLGENVTTRGVDLLGLPRGTRLRIGSQAVVEVTGLRNPGPRIESYKQGLLSKVLFKDKYGNLVRKAGIMGVVVTSGHVMPGDAIQVDVPAKPHYALDVV